MPTPATALVTGAMALAFVAVHLFVARLAFLSHEPRSRFLSFAGGVAVGYVFLHVLPELGTHGPAFGRAANVGEVLAEALVYTLALAGLALFYGLERALKVSRGERRAAEGRDRPEPGVFWLHIAASGVLIFIIGYLLNHREDMSAGGLALFFGALLLHFVTADFGTRADHPELYDAKGRWVLAAATLAGWGLGTQLTLPDLAVGGLFAFVGGAIVLVVLKEELPEERSSRFWPFLGGAVLYSALVLGELALGS